MNPPKSVERLRTASVDEAERDPPMFKMSENVEDAFDTNPSILPRLSIEKIVVEAEFTILKRSAVCPVWDFKVRGVESVLVAPMVKTEFGSGEVVPMPKASVAAKSVVVPKVETPVPRSILPAFEKTPSVPFTSRRELVLSR